MTNIDPTSLLNDDLRNLRSLFQEAGFDIRLVGGCVRDLIYGKTPKDIDLCTDANPTQQVEIYQKNNIRYIETGLQHGTISAVLNDILYEITSLRTDVETDGRHAIVAYTTDWVKDLERRDFTINSMNLDFEGNLLDPFGGRRDLAEGKVKFVGDPYLRIKEDYLRIFRWFRFRGRFNHENVEPIDAAAVYKLKRGLNLISKERIWSELKQILVNDNAFILMAEMIDKTILAECGMRTNYVNLNLQYRKSFINEVIDSTKNPITILVAFFGSASVELLTMLKASREETNLAWFLSDVVIGPDAIHPTRMMALHGTKREDAIEAAILQRHDQFSIAVLHEWEPPEFPINGYDLIRLGMKPGPQYGEILFSLKEKWCDSNYVLDKEDLLKEANKLL